MDERVRLLAQALLSKGFEQLPERDQRVIRRIANRAAITRDVNSEFYQQSTLGERMSDRIAGFGGSWTFLIIFGAVLAAWMILNSVILGGGGEAFDPYPYILLNLVLSTIAAIQAPVILMSQNRQAAKDRMAAEHDYEVNLKAELEILQLHGKIDQLQHEQWSKLMALQEDQIAMLTRVIDAKAAG